MPRNRAGERLSDVLGQKDPALVSQLEKIKEKGYEDWIGLLQADLGSHSGYPHLQNVERIADRIVPDEIKHDLSAEELFLLLTAIFFHDIGKAIPFKLKTPCDKIPGQTCDIYQMKINDPKTQDYKPDEHPPCRKPLWDHYRESERIILEQGVSLGLPDERIAQYCGLLAFCHGLPLPPEDDQPLPLDKNASFHKCPEMEGRRSDFRNTSVTPYGRLRIPLLAAILRTADETDNSWTRAIRDYWHRRLTEETQNLGKAFRRHIEDIEFSHEGNCLIVHVAEIPNQNGAEDIKRINGAVEELRTVIKSDWGRILKKHRIRFTEVYIEHEEHLYCTLGVGKAPALGMVVDDPSLELGRLFDALVKLALGSYGHNTFTWYSLEAQVGRPLTELDKWLIDKIGNATDELTIWADPLEDSIRIEIRQGADINQVRRGILG